MSAAEMGVSCVPWKDSVCRVRGSMGLSLIRMSWGGCAKEVIPAFFVSVWKTVPAFHKAIDLITMFHVIEHVDDPAKVVRQIACRLSPGGIFALETPNVDSLDARLFHRTYWGGYHVPRHWNLFMPPTIARLLSDSGLEVLATVFQTGHSFWMYSLHHCLRYEGASRPRLGGLFDPMKSLFGLAAFTGFDLLGSAAGAKTSAMLVICRKP
jgi:SAM-dependent methyltransferase